MFWGPKYVNKPSILPTSAKGRPLHDIKLNKENKTCYWCFILHIPKESLRLGYWSSSLLSCESLHELNWAARFMNWRCTGIGEIKTMNQLWMYPHSALLSWVFYPISSFISEYCRYWWHRRTMYLQHANLSFLLVLTDCSWDSLFWVRSAARCLSSPFHSFSKNYQPQPIIHKSSTFIESTLWLSSPTDISGNIQCYAWSLDRRIRTLFFKIIR